MDFGSVHQSKESGKSLKCSRSWIHYKLTKRFFWDVLADFGTSRNKNQGIQPSKVILAKTITTEGFWLFSDNLKVQEDSGLTVKKLFLWQNPFQTSLVSLLWFMFLLQFETVKSFSSSFITLQTILSETFNSAAIFLADLRISVHSGSDDLLNFVEKWITWF